MKTKNVLGAVRSRLGTAQNRGRTSPEIGGSASKRRPRRMIVLVLAAVLASVPISATVQTVGAGKADAAVDDRYSWVTSTVAMTAFSYWMNTANWPATGSQNAAFNTGHGYVNGGGAYGDRDGQLAGWLSRQTGHWGPWDFREYDGEVRQHTWDNRGAQRYVLNLQTGIVFHTEDHYADFTPLNFGNLPTPGFPDHVFCYEHPTGQPNDRRIVLHSGHWNRAEWTVHGLPGSGMEVDYQRDWEWWNSHDGQYYVDTNADNFRQYISFNAQHSLNIHNDPSALCREFTGFWYGTW
ncbi:ribonuclease domain-containing protein [Amycolatopsis balhimycina]|nr:ribonuclease domain-containing protein [Amycolatopsis balhimycina]